MCHFIEQAGDAGYDATRYFAACSRSPSESYHLLSETDTLLNHDLGPERHSRSYATIPNTLERPLTVIVARSLHNSTIAEFTSQAANNAGY